MSHHPRLFVKHLLGICAVVAIVLWYQGGVVIRDFVAFQAAGTMLWETPGKLYNLDEQLKVQRALGVTGEEFVPFPYPPVVALVFVPGRWLSVDAFFLAMLAGNLILLTCALLLAIRRLRLETARAETLLLVASTAFPVYFNLIAGQLGFVSLLLYILFLSELLKENSAKAGFWIGALAFKPTLMAIPAGMLLWRRDWRNLARAAIVCLATLLVALPLVGWNGLKQQLAVMYSMGTNPVALKNLPAMQNLRALSHYLGLGDGGWVALSMLVVVGLAVALRGRRWDRWSVSALLLAAVLVPPHLHAYDLAVLIILPALGFPTSNWYQRFYVVLGLLPLAHFALRAHLPVTPFSLFVLFWLCVYKSRQKLQEPTAPQGQQQGVRPTASSLTLRVLQFGKLAYLRERVTL